MPSWCARTSCATSPWARAIATPRSTAPRKSALPSWQPPSASSPCSCRWASWRNHRTVLPPVRHHRGGGRAAVDVRQLHPRPDAVLDLVRPGRPRRARQGPVRAHAHLERAVAAKVQRALFEIARLGARASQERAWHRPRELHRRVRPGAENRLRIRARGGPRRNHGAIEYAGGIFSGIHPGQDATGGSGAARIPRSHLHLRHRQHRNHAGKNYSTIFVRLLDRGQRDANQKQLQRPMRARLQEIAGIE